MSALDALLGRLYNSGEELELGGGIDFGDGLDAAYNPTTKRVEVTNTGASGGGGTGTGALEAVRVAAVTNIALTGTYTLQGVALVNGDSVGAFAQTDGTASGVYTVNSGGAWARRSDFNESSELIAGATGVILEGTYNGGSWTLLSDGASIGVTPLDFKVEPFVDVTGANGVALTVVSGVPTLAKIGDTHITNDTLSPAKLASGGAGNNDLYVGVAGGVTTLADPHRATGVYLMPPPSGTDDSAAFDALRTLAESTGGTIKFRSGTYKSPTGFVLTHSQGVTLEGVGATLDGLDCTVLQHTGARATLSAAVAFLSTINCHVRDLCVVSVFGGAENGVYIYNDGSGDPINCTVDSVRVFGNAAAVVNTTSTTSISLTTAATLAPVAFTLVSTAGSYPVGTQVLFASRAGDGYIHATVDSLVGSVLTATPILVAGTATKTDWDVLQPINGIQIAGGELCEVSNCQVVLAFNSFRINGRSCISGHGNIASSPLGPQYRTDGGSASIRLFGTAEWNSRYLWTQAVYISGCTNLECSVAMGDNFNRGIPYVFRSVRGGFVHNINAQNALTAEGYVMSLTSCTGVHINTVVGSIPSGAYVQNVSGNTLCKVKNLYTDGAIVMATFGGGTFAGFTEWDDATTGLPNADVLATQFVQSKNGIQVAGVSMVLPNGLTVDRSLSSGFHVITGPTGAFSISGFAPPSDGKLIRFAYFGTQTLTLKHQDASSAAANRLICRGAVDAVLTPTAGGYVYFEILYSSTAGGWLVLLPL